MVGNRLEDVRQVGIKLLPGATRDFRMDLLKGKCGAVTTI